jgi:proteasome lid subunit RPN8/RPN11
MKDFKKFPKKKELKKGFQSQTLKMCGWKMSFNELSISRNTFRKMMEYAKILEEESTYMREFGGIMVKSKEQKDDVVTDIFVPRQKATSSDFYVPYSEVYNLFFEINSKNKKPLGRFHYHCLFPPYPSLKDKKERRIILAENLIFNQLFLLGGETIEGKFIDVKIKEENNKKEIFLKSNNPYLGRIKLTWNKEQTLLNKSKNVYIIHNILKNFLKKTDPYFFDVEDFIQANFFIVRPKAYGYGYNFIFNKSGEMYAEIIYQRIDSCGPVGKIKYKPLNVKIVDHHNDVKFTEEEIRNDIISKFDLSEREYDIQNRGR